MATITNKLLASALMSVPLLGMISYTESVNSERKVPFMFDTFPIMNEQLIYNVYCMAPEEIKGLVVALKAGNSVESFIRPLLFTGPPGTGKTTLASLLAVILNKVSKEKFLYKYVNASSLGDHYQNSKACDVKELINHVINNIKEPNTYCVLVIDELHALFSGKENNSSSQAHDAAVAFKHAMERLQKKKKVLPIFTTNYPEKIPLTLRQMFMNGSVFHFDQPSREKQYRAMEYHFKKDNNLTLGISEKEREQFVEKLDGWSFRRIEALCNEAMQNAYLDSGEECKSMLTLSNLQEAFNTLEEHHKLLKFNHEEPSDQERFCNENMALQKEFHDKQLKLAKDTIDFNEKLHNLSMIMQLRANKTGGTRGNAYFGSKVKYWMGSYHIVQEWDYSGCLSGDTKNALPEDIQKYYTVSRLSSKEKNAKLIFDHILKIKKEEEKK